MTIERRCHVNFGTNQWFKMHTAIGDEQLNVDVRNDETIAPSWRHFTTTRAKITIGVLVVLWIVGVSLLDRSRDEPVALTSLLSIGPVVASLALAPVVTTCSALLALALSIPLGAGDFRFLSIQHFVDTGDVVVIGSLSVYISILRERSMQLLALSERRATRDGLTGILNRRAVFYMGDRLAEWRHEIRPPMALMMIDVDHLKEVNDTYGHHAGDRVLTAVSERLTSALRTGDVVGRYGGDEFVAILIGGGRDDFDRIAERIIDSMHDAVVPVEGGDHAISVSIGLSDLGPNETDLQPALLRADVALYESKRNGRGRFTRDDQSF